MIELSTDGCYCSFCGKRLNEENGMIGEDMYTYCTEHVHHGLTERCMHTISAGKNACGEDLACFRPMGHRGKHRYNPKDLTQSENEDIKSIKEQQKCK